MKKLLSLAIASILFINVTNAQTERATEAKPKTERKAKKQEKMKLAKELNLSKEQMAQIKENQKVMQEKRKALKANDQITVAEMKEKQAALVKEQKENMNKILTAEQKAKMETLKKDRKKGHGKHKKNKGAEVSAVTE
jgi:Spy/CpxP family protein refolding chaperone